MNIFHSEAEKSKLVNKKQSQDFTSLNAGVYK